nr:ejaculatory bulb-specific protein 3-like [Leptinotarsa decemlineata]
MNRLLFFFLLLGGVVLVLSHEKKDRSHIPQYTSKYDNIDIDAILNNDRIFKNYIDCCLGKGRCTPDGQELKSHIRDAMEHECDKCSELHKKTMKKIGKKLYREKPEWWKELCDHFDPDHKYRTRYQKFIDDALAEKD